MEISTNYVVKLKKLSRCKLCKNDAFVVVETGTEFVLKCTDCKTAKTIKAKNLKLSVAEVVSATFKPTLMDF